MARARGQKQYVAMTKGLVTEASPLNAPEGSTSDELNMDLKINGMVRTRRKGLQKQGTDKALLGQITGSYYWSAAGYVVLSSLSLEPDTTYDTVTLYFLDPADNSLLFSYRVLVLDSSASNPSFSEVRNRLVTSFGTKPFVFSKEASGNISGWSMDLYVRDFKLIDDEEAVSNRPTTLSDEHQYNIYNAGWYQTIQENGGLEFNAATSFFNELGVYPSNADILSLGIGADAGGNTIFQPGSMRMPLMGNTTAPRGHYVYNIREIDRQARNGAPLVDGVPSATLTKLLDDGTNISGNPTDILFVDAPASGTGVDPDVPTTRPPGFIEP